MNIRDIRFVEFSGMEVGICFFPSFFLFAIFKKRKKGKRFFLTRRYLRTRLFLIGLIIFDHG